MENRISQSPASEDNGQLEITSKKLAPKIIVKEDFGLQRNKAAIRNGDILQNHVVLRPDLSQSQPTLKLAHYRKPNFVPTEHGLKAQTLQAQNDLTSDRLQRAYSDSESDAPPQFALDVNRIFDFTPKTPQEADIQNRVNSVPSLKQLNELRKYKLGIHPEKKFRMMLSASQSNLDATAEFVKDYMIEADKEKRSIPCTAGMNVNPSKTLLQSRPASSPLTTAVSETRDKSRASSAGIREQAVIKSAGNKYDNGIRLAPMVAVEVKSKRKGATDTSSIASLNSVSTGRSSSPIYTPATFRVPKSVEDGNKQPYDMYASKDTATMSFLALSSTEEIADNTGSAKSSRAVFRGGKVVLENPAETANRLLAMHDSDSFQDSRREQFLQDSLAEDDTAQSENTHSLIQQIRVTDMPGRSRIPKKYGHFIEELDDENPDPRSKSRQERLRTKSPSTRLQEGTDADYEALRKTGTSHGSKLNCSKCYVQGVLWCTSCVQAFCLACWNSVPHHTLYNMVPAFPNHLSKRYKQKFQKVVKECTPGYLAPAPAVTTGKREFERPPPTMVGIPRLLSPATGASTRPRSGSPGRSRSPNPSSPYRDEALASMPWSPASSPAEDNQNDKSFSPKVLFASKKAARTAAAAQEIEIKLHNAYDSNQIYDGNALPAKMPVVNQQTVVYQDYTIPGVVLNGRGEILELSDDFSDSQTSSPPFLRSSSRPDTGKSDAGKRYTGNPPRHPHSPTSNDSPEKPLGVFDGNPNFKGEVKNAIHYVLPSKIPKMAALGMPRSSTSPSSAPLIPSGFDNSSPHKQLVRKITREGARNLRKKGDTRVFSPSFSLGGGAAVHGGGANSSSSNIAATISRPSTVARPLTGITKDIVFPSPALMNASVSVSASASQVVEEVGDGNWKDGNLNLSSKNNARHKNNYTGPPKITIYDGVPVYTRQDLKKNTIPNPLAKFPMATKKAPFVPSSTQPQL